MDFSLTEEQKKKIDKADMFAQREIAPHVCQMEDDLEFRKTVFSKMAKEGFFNPDPDLLTYAYTMKVIAKVDAGVTVALSVTRMVYDAIEKFGTPEQKKKYSPNESNVPMAFALTEKETGSDAKSISLQARKEGNEYILNGEKRLISNGDSAGVVLVLAKTEEGITAFLVERGTKGFSSPKKENKLGLLTANLVSLSFDNVRLSADKVLGDLGKGFAIAMESLNHGRLGVAAQALGIGEAAYEAALHYAKNRKQFGRSLSEQQVIAFKLADMRVKLDAGQLLVDKAAWRPTSLAISEAKLFCSEAANQIAYDALQIHGGYGYTKDYPVEKYFRDARVTTLYEGTSEIQRLIIAREILKAL